MPEVDQLTVRSRLVVGLLVLCIAALASLGCSSTAEPAGSAGPADPTEEPARIEFQGTGVSGALIVPATALPAGVQLDDLQVTVEFADATVTTAEGGSERAASIIGVTLEPSGTSFAEPLQLLLEPEQELAGAQITAVLETDGAFEPISIQRPVRTETGTALQIPIPHFSKLVVTVQSGHRPAEPQLVYDPPGRPYLVGEQFSVSAVLSRPDVIVDNRLQNVELRDVERPVGTQRLPDEFFGHVPPERGWQYEATWVEAREARSRRWRTVSSEDAVLAHAPDDSGWTSGIAAATATAPVTTTVTCARPGNFVLQLLGITATTMELTIIRDEHRTELADAGVGIMLDRPLVFGTCVEPTPTPTSTPEVTPTPEADRDPLPIDVLTIDGKRVPTEQLEPLAPHGGCDEWHFHAANAHTLEGTLVDDPAPDGCGFGRFLDVVNVEVDWPAFEGYRARLAGAD